MAELEDMGDYSWPEDDIASSRAKPEIWAAIREALPIGTEASGTVIGRQRFGVFLSIDDVPDVIGLVEVASMPPNASLPTRGTRVTGTVVGHAEHNQQVRIKLRELTDGQWALIEPFILARTNIQALKHIRETFSCDLRTAINLLDERYALLQRTRPDEFTPPRS